MHVTAIGTGLIGCSLGLVLRKAGHFVTGVDKNEKHLQEALDRGALDATRNLEDALSETDLVVLCIPVDAIVSLLPKLLDSIPSHTTVMDMGSTKLDICNVADNHHRRENFVAVHPMAGVEHSGPGAAHVDMFLHARVLICNPQNSSTEALNKVLGILQELKMKVIFMDAQDHDRQLALVSHLPQFMAYALSSMEEFDQDTHKNWTELGGGGLQSSIRLGKSDANMWMPVFQQNKENLLQFLDSYLHQLTEMKKMIENNHNDDLNELIQKANANYEKLNYHNNKPRPLVPNQGAPKVFYS
ncbi:MAG: prephenate dehydrogenase/arogenate dehydrogenase family protein [Bacteroidales bacterium]